ncbi:MAG: RNA pseudouridine synthase [Vicingaceae bacterium]
MIADKDVLYEDNHLIAVNKKAGVLVQGDKTGDDSLLDGLSVYLKIKYNKPGNVFTGLIHRIDRPVSGLVLLAKTSKGLSRMNELFKNRKITKTYLAIVEGKVDQKNGTLVSFMKKNEKQNKSYVSKKENGGYKRAELQFETLQLLDHYSLLEVFPLTGRHHQIRAQLAEMGHPIKGDLKYGAKRSNEDGSICLHAFRLEFEHPIKKETLTIRAPVPQIDTWKYISP